VIKDSLLLYTKVKCDFGSLTFSQFQNF